MRGVAEGGELRRSHVVCNVVARKDFVSNKVNEKFPSKSLFIRVC